MKILTAFCDLNICPVSYDFITWLVRAMLERDAQGCEGLHVVFVPKEDGLGGFARHWGPHDEAATRWRLWHICVAACPLARATVTLAPNLEYATERLPLWISREREHLAKPLVEASRKGVKIPKLRATEAARRYIASWLKGSGPVVTLTMRKQTNDTARNSDRGAWDQFAAWLRERGYVVVSLDDTNEALAQGRGYAELDIDLRLALYEHAEMNVVGNNGPAALLWHSDAPYMRIGSGIPADWTTNLGLAQGEQIPWAASDQRLVYAPDTFEAMRDHFMVTR